MGPLYFQNQMQLGSKRIDIKRFLNSHIPTDIGFVVRGENITFHFLVIIDVNSM